MADERTGSMCVRGTRPLRTRGGRGASGFEPGSSGTAHSHQSSDAFEMSVSTSPAEKLSSAELCEQKSTLIISIIRGAQFHGRSYKYRR